MSARTSNTSEAAFGLRTKRHQQQMDKAGSIAENNYVLALLGTLSRKSILPEPGTATSQKNKLINEVQRLRFHQSQQLQYLLRRRALRSQLELLFSIGAGAGDSTAATRMTRASFHFFLRSMGITTDTPYYIFESRNTVVLRDRGIPDFPPDVAVHCRAAVAQLEVCPPAKLAAAKETITAHLIKLLRVSSDSVDALFNYGTGSFLQDASQPSTSTIAQPRLPGSLQPQPDTLSFADFCLVTIELMHRMVPEIDYPPLARPDLFIQLMEGFYLGPLTKLFVDKHMPRCVDDYNIPPTVKELIVDNYLDLLSFVFGSLTHPYMMLTNDEIQKLQTPGSIEAQQAIPSILKKSLLSRAKLANAPVSSDEDYSVDDVMRAQFFVGMYVGDVALEYEQFIALLQHVNINVRVMGADVIYRLFQRYDCRMYPERVSIDFHSFILLLIHMAFAMYQDSSTPLTIATVTQDSAADNAHVTSDPNEPQLLGNGPISVTYNEPTTLPTISSRFNRMMVDHFVPRYKVNPLLFYYDVNDPAHTERLVKPLSVIHKQGAEYDEAHGDIKQPVLDGIKPDCAHRGAELWLFGSNFPARSTGYGKKCAVYVRFGTDSTSSSPLLRDGLEGAAIKKAIGGQAVEAVTARVEEENCQPTGLHDFNEYDGTLSRGWCLSETMGSVPVPHIPDTEDTHIETIVKVQEKPEFTARRLAEAAAGEETKERDAGDADLSEDQLELLGASVEYAHEEDKNTYSVHVETTTHVPVFISMDRLTWTSRTDIIFAYKDTLLELELSYDLTKALRQLFNAFAIRGSDRHTNGKLTLGTLYLGLQQWAAMCRLAPMGVEEDGELDTMFNRHHLFFEIARPRADYADIEAPIVDFQGFIQLVFRHYVAIHGVTPKLKEYMEAAIVPVAADVGSRWRREQASIQYAFWTQTREAEKVSAARALALGVSQALVQPLDSDLTMVRSASHSYLSNVQTASVSNLAQNLLSLESKKGVMCVNCGCNPTIYDSNPLFDLGSPRSCGGETSEVSTPASGRGSKPSSRNMPRPSASSSSILKSPRERPDSRQSALIPVGKPPKSERVKQAVSTAMAMLKISKFFGDGLPVTVPDDELHASIFRTLSSLLDTLPHDSEAENITSNTYCHMPFKDAMKLSQRGRCYYLVCLLDRYLFHHNAIVAEGEQYFQSSIGKAKTASRFLHLQLCTLHRAMQAISGSLDRVEGYLDDVLWMLNDERRARLAGQMTAAETLWVMTQRLFSGIKTSLVFINDLTTPYIKDGAESLTIEGVEHQARSFYELVTIKYNEIEQAFRSRVKEVTAGPESDAIEVLKNNKQSAIDALNENINGPAKSRTVVEEAAAKKEETLAAKVKPPSRQRIRPGPAMNNMNLDDYKRALEEEYQIKLENQRAAILAEAQSRIDQLEMKYRDSERNAAGLLQALLNYAQDEIIVPTSITNPVFVYLKERGVSPLLKTVFGPDGKKHVPVGEEIHQPGEGDKIISTADACCQADEEELPTIGDMIIELESRGIINASRLGLSGILLRRALHVGARTLTSFASNVTIFDDFSRMLRTELQRALRGKLSDRIFLPRDEMDCNRNDACINTNLTLSDWVDADRYAGLELRAESLAAVIDSADNAFKTNAPVLKDPPPPTSKKVKGKNEYADLSIALKVTQIPMPEGSETEKTPYSSDVHYSSLQMRLLRFAARRDAKLAEKMFKHITERSRHCQTANADMVRVKSTQTDVPYYSPSRGSVAKSQSPERGIDDRQDSLVNQTQPVRTKGTREQDGTMQRSGSLARGGEKPKRRKRREAPQRDTDTFLTKVGDATEDDSGNLYEIEESSESESDSSTDGIEGAARREEEMPPKKQKENAQTSQRDDNAKGDRGTSINRKGKTKDILAAETETNATAKSQGGCEETRPSVLGLSENSIITPCPSPATALDMSEVVPQDMAPLQSASKDAWVVVEGVIEDDALDNADLHTTEAANTAESLIRRDEPGATRNTIDRKRDRKGTDQTSLDRGWKDMGSDYPSEDSDESRDTERKPGKPTENNTDKNEAGAKERRARNARYMRESGLFPDDGNPSGISLEINDQGAYDNLMAQPLLPDFESGAQADMAVQGRKYLTEKGASSKRHPTSVFLDARLSKDMFAKEYALLQQYEGDAYTALERADHISLMSDGSDSVQIIRHELIVRKQIIDPATYLSNREPEDRSIPSRVYYVGDSKEHKKEAKRLLKTLRRDDTEEEEEGLQSTDRTMAIKNLLEAINANDAFFDNSDYLKNEQAPKYSARTLTPSRGGGVAGALARSRAACAPGLFDYKRQVGKDPLLGDAPSQLDRPLLLEGFSPRSACRLEDEAMLKALISVLGMKRGEAQTIIKSMHWRDRAHNEDFKVDLMSGLDEPRAPSVHFIMSMLEGIERPKAEWLQRAYAEFIRQGLAAKEALSEQEQREMINLLREKGSKELHELLRRTPTSRERDADRNDVSVSLNNASFKEYPSPRPSQSYFQDGEGLKTLPMAEYQTMKEQALAAKIVLDERDLVRAHMLPLIRDHGDRGALDSFLRASHNTAGLFELAKLLEGELLKASHARAQDAYYTARRNLAEAPVTPATKLPEAAPTAIQDMTIVGAKKTLPETCLSVLNDHYESTWPLTEIEHIQIENNSAFAIKYLIQRLERSFIKDESTDKVKEKLLDNLTRLRSIILSSSSASDTEKYGKAIERMSDALIETSLPKKIDTILPDSVINGDGKESTALNGEGNLSELQKKSSFIAIPVSGHQEVNYQISSIFSVLDERLSIPPRSALTSQRSLNIWRQHIIKYLLKRVLEAQHSDIDAETPAMDSFYDAAFEGLKHLPGAGWSGVCATDIGKIDRLLSYDQVSLEQQRQIFFFQLRAASFILHTVASDNTRFAALAMDVMRETTAAPHSVQQEEAAYNYLTKALFGSHHEEGLSALKMAASGDPQEKRAANQIMLSPSSEWIGQVLEFSLDEYDWLQRINPSSERFGKLKAIARNVEKKMLNIQGEVSLSPLRWLSAAQRFLSIFRSKFLRMWQKPTEPPEDQLVEVREPMTDDNISYCPPAWLKRNTGFRSGVGAARLHRVLYKEERRKPLLTSTSRQIISALKPINYQSSTSNKELREILIPRYISDREEAPLFNATPPLTSSERTELQELRLQVASNLSSKSLSPLVYQRWLLLEVRGALDAFATARPQGTNTTDIMVAFVDQLAGILRLTADGSVGSLSLSYESSAPLPRRTLAVVDALISLTPTQVKAFVNDLGPLRMRSTPINTNIITPIRAAL